MPRHLAVPCRTATGDPVPTAAPQGGLGIRRVIRLLSDSRLPRGRPDYVRTMVKTTPVGRIFKMGDAKPHLRTLEEIERTCVPGLVEVLRTEGVEGVRYALWDMTGWHRDYDPCVWRSRASEEQRRVGWEMWVRMEKIIATFLHEAHRLQVEEAMGALEEGPESFCGSSADR